MKVKSIKVEYEDGNKIEYDTTGELYTKKQVTGIFQSLLKNMETEK